MDNRWTLDNIGNLGGTIAIVTGANKGLGFETAKELAGHGATVILACRDLHNAKAAKAQILACYPFANLDIIHLDLADLDSVKQFCTDFSHKYCRLDLLINNGGILNVPFGKTKQGLELIMGTNFFGPFALTAGLYPFLLNSDKARIVEVGSDRHRSGKIDFEEGFHGPHPYQGVVAMMQKYAESKLAGMMFAFRMARLFKENNIPIISVAAHPGACVMYPTRAKHESCFNKFFAAGQFISNYILSIPIEEGVKAILQAATEQNLQGGEYYSPHSWLFQELRGDVKLTQAADAAYDEESARKLWEAAEQLTGVKFEIQNKALTYAENARLWK